MTELATPAAKPPPARSAPAPSLARRITRRVWRFTIGFLAIVGFVTIVHPFFFDLSELTSGSMSPTLQGDATSGDWVLAEKISYHLREPRRGEVIEFRDADGTQIMKRVMAFPGETVAVEKNRVQVNGSFLDPPPGAAHVKYFPFGNLGSGKPYAVKTGYYVMGDDSIDSEDSRFEGSVKREQIRARAWFILWPLSRIGFVH